MTAPPDAPLTDELIAEALKLCDAATPGPWMSRTEIGHPGVVAVARPESFDWVCSMQVSNTPRFAQDAAFIAAARTLLPQALRELKALRTQLAHLAESAGDDSCADFARKLNAERDSLRAQLDEVTRERDEAHARAALEAQHHHHLRKERDDLRDQVADFSEHHASLVEKAMEVDALRARLVEAERERDELCAEIADADAPDGAFAIIRDRTAEAIAEWLDGHHGGRDDDPHNIASDVVADIRAGAWRAKEGT